jgi:hypothetical protein
MLKNSDHYLKVRENWDVENVGQGEIGLGILCVYAERRNCNSRIVKVSQ